MRSYLFVSSEGSLYDTRKTDWHLKPPLREDYRRVVPEISNTRDLRASLRVRYVFPGGYELIWFTRDGGCLCYQCVKDNYRQVSNSVRHGLHDGWNVVAVDVTSNYDESSVCDHCGMAVMEVEDGH